MKTASQTASTYARFSNNSDFIKNSHHRNLSKGKFNDNQNDLIDFNKFQKQMNRLQQKIIRQEIEKYESINLQKQFPSLLKQLKQKSQKLISLENKFNTIKEQRLKEIQEIENEQQNVEQEKQNLEQELFRLQYEALLKQQYEKQFILGMIDNSQNKIKNLMEDREDKNEEKCKIFEQKKEILKEIEEEKQKILNLSIIKAKIEEELHFVNNCQIEPIHLIREKSLKTYEAKVKYFSEKFIGDESKKGLIQKYCQRYEELTEKQLVQMSFSQQSQCFKESIVMQNKLFFLQNKLNHLTSDKLQKSDQINVELFKSKVLKKQIEDKDEQIKKYEQLLTYVRNQPYCIQKIQENDEIGTQVVTNLKLQKTVDDQVHENHLLKNKLKQLIEKLNSQKQTNVNLNSLLRQVKSDHEMRTDKLMAENHVLKSNLQIKKKIYENKIEVRQHIIQAEPIKPGTRMDYFMNSKNVYENDRLNDKKLQRQASNFVSKPIQPSIIFYDKPQTLQSKLSQLRGRLMKKFQAAESIKSSH